MHTATGSQPTGRVTGSIHKSAHKRPNSEPPETQALRLECVLVDLPPHKRRQSMSQVQKPNASTRTRVRRERSAYSQNTTALNSDAAGASTRRKTKKRHDPSTPSIPADEQLLHKAGSSTRRSQHNKASALLTPSSSNTLDVDTRSDDSESTSRPKKRSRFYGTDTSPLSQEVCPTAQITGRSTSPEVVLPEDHENEEDVLMPDFQLLNIPESCSLPWVSTPVPLFDDNGNSSDSNVFLPPGISCIVQSMRHALALEHIARQKAEERCEREARLHADAERQVAILQAEIARLEGAQMSWLATTAETLASNITQFSQSLQDKKRLRTDSALELHSDVMSRMGLPSDVKGKGQMEVSVSELA